MLKKYLQVKMATGMEPTTECSETIVAPSGGRSLASAEMMVLWWWWVVGSGYIGHETVYTEFIELKLGETAWHILDMTNWMPTIGMSSICQSSEIKWFLNLAKRRISCSATSPYHGVQCKNHDLRWIFQPNQNLDWKLHELLLRGVSNLEDHPI